MKHKDKILIQKKVDGQLSPPEEKQFKKLIDTSSKARKFYRELIMIDHHLEEDAKNTKPVDVSQEILRRIKSRTVQHTSAKRSGRVITPVFRQNLLAYAAILITGIIIGSAITFFGTHRGNEPGTEQIAGTIASLPDNTYHYNKNGTEITTAEFKSGKFIITTIAVHTRETVHCRILPEKNNLTGDQVTRLFTDGLFQQLESTEGELQYACTGNVVFQINRSGQNNSSCPMVLEFIKNDVSLKQLYFNGNE